MTRALSRDGAVAFAAVTTCRTSVLVMVRCRGTGARYPYVLTTRPAWFGELVRKAFRP
ncbi:hypothetical protein ACWGIU_13000 [Streptomyces sp. NPDC054840]